MSRNSTKAPERKCISHVGLTYDTSEGWIGPISDAEEGNPIMLLRMLLEAPEPGSDARALVADFLSRYRFAQRSRGRPKGTEAKPWSKEDCLHFARKLLLPEPPPGWRMKLFAQLLEYRTVRHNRRTPVYERTLADAKLLSAAAETRLYMSQTGKKRDIVADHVAPLHGLDPETMINYMDGKRGSRRHLAK
jgi:hypothetical protein